MSRIGVLCAAAAMVGSCGGEKIASHDALAHQVERGRVGISSDYWIEMASLAGGWERVGLVFGYTDDQAECMKAISGLKQANYRRQYRCQKAN